MRHNEIKHENRMESVHPFDLTKSKSAPHCRFEPEEFRFKANPVPQSTLEPRYEAILREKEKKREAIREELEVHRDKMPKSIKNMLVR